MAEEKKLFTQREVNLLFTHIPAKTLRWWGVKQLYGWVYEDIDGRGIHRRYELANLYQIGLVEQLADLGLPINLIRVIMVNHFCYGMRMGERTKPSLNISEQMGKLLVIEKTFNWIGVDPERGPIINWLPFLVEKDDVALPEGVDVAIFLKLQSIKEYVDSLVKQAG